MSQENVEMVRRALDAQARRDLRTLDSLASEEAELHSILAASEGRVFRGRQGIRDYFAAIDEAFDDFRADVKEIIDAGEDRVVALIKFSARGRTSGIALDDEGTTGVVYTIQGEQITRIESYPSPAQALAAAGLEE